jgi:exopolysaccharide/PEP-CTERM locus tyrosine autokinase
MSLIENALRKLQGSRPEVGAAHPTGSAVAGATAATRKKKVAIEGPKFHVAQDSLVKSGLLAPPEAAARVADEFRRIKRPLITNAFEAVPVNTVQYQNVIMVASALPNAGKSFCALNLALSLSLERELNVLLVDADVGKRHITRACGLSDNAGLIDLLVEEGRDIQEFLVRTDMNDIQILPSGRSHPQATELLASERMSSLIGELSTRYADRIVLFDSPPLLITNEAQALSSHVGQVAFVVEAGQTTPQQLTQALDFLEKTRPINIILNKSQAWGWDRFGDYSGDYSYGHE